MPDIFLCAFAFKKCAAIVQHRRRHRDSCSAGRLVAALAAFMLATAGTQATPGQHTLTVTFNYDFTTDNACSATGHQGLSVPAPAGSTSAVTGITGTSGLLPLKSGVHTFGATTQMAAAAF